MSFIILIFQLFIVSMILFLIKSTKDELVKLEIGKVLKVRSDISNPDKYYYLKIPSGIQPNQKDLVFDLYSTDQETNNNPEIFISTV